DRRTACANACACPGSENVGPPSSCGKAVIAPLGVSGGFKIPLPEVHIDEIPRGCCVSPQLTRGKANRVHVIRIGAEVVLVSVRKVIRPTLTGDGSYLTARIPGQSCVRR